MLYLNFNCLLMNSFLYFKIFRVLKSIKHNIFYYIFKIILLYISHFLMELSHDIFSRFRYTGLAQFDSPTKQSAIRAVIALLLSTIGGTSPNMTDNTGGKTKRNCQFGKSDCDSSSRKRRRWMRGRRINSPMGQPARYCGWTLEAPFRPHTGQTRQVIAVQIRS